MHTSIQTCMYVYVCMYACTHISVVTLANAVLGKSFLSK